jgi:hypothetical protein
VAASALLVHLAHDQVDLCRHTLQVSLSVHTNEREQEERERKRSGNLSVLGQGKGLGLAYDLVRELEGLPRAVERIACRDAISQFSYSRPIRNAHDVSNHRPHARHDTRNHPTVVPTLLARYQTRRPPHNGPKGERR